MMRDVYIAPRRSIRTDFSLELFHICLLQKTSVDPLGHLIGHHVEMRKLPPWPSGSSAFCFLVGGSFLRAPMNQIRQWLNGFSKEGPGLGLPVHLAEAIEGFSRDHVFAPYFVPWELAGANRGAACISSQACDSHQISNELCTVWS
jgi:hypothetical protein